MTSIDDQIPRIPQTEKDEIEEGSKVDHSININQIFDEKFKESCTIFKVNVWLRESNPDAYTPKMVSIGPYHKRDVQLHPMEKYKWLYLRRFLERKKGLDAESCIKELEGLKEEAINCYEDVETDEFCQMLLLDGCFVVEFIRECWGMCPEGEDKIINDNIVGYIVRDLLLLENQLPFFVLDKLHDMKKRDDELALAILASIISLRFFVKLPEMTTGTFQEITGGNFKHLFDLKYAISCHGNLKKPKDDLPRPMVTSNATELSEAGGCYNDGNGKDNDDQTCHMVMQNATELSESFIIQSVCRHLGHAGNGKDKDDQTWHMVMPNATELSEAGVSFEKVNVATTELSEAGVSFAKTSFKTSIFDSIKFENGSMTIPRFRVTDNTETLLRNLIAYEQQSSDVQTKYFSDFSTFMDYLIDSDKDVNLLRQKGIIENWLGDDKEVANLFNKIGNGVIITDPDFYYNEECRKAVKHCKKIRNKYRANLKHNYFSSPWVGASTVAAIVLVILTLTQTVLAFIDLFSK